MGDVEEGDGYLTLVRRALSPTHGLVAEGFWLSGINGKHSR